MCFCVFLSLARSLFLHLVNVGTVMDSIVVVGGGGFVFVVFGCVLPFLCPNDRRGAYRQVFALDHHWHDNSIGVEDVVVKQAMYLYVPLLVL